MELRNATGFVLAEDYISTLSFPPFDQSAMDGYAVNNKDDAKSDNAPTNLQKSAPADSKKSKNL